MILSELPDGVLHAIAEKLDPIGYHNLRCVSKTFRRVMDVNPLYLQPPSAKDLFDNIKRIVTKYDDRRLFTLRMTGNNVYVKISNVWYEQIKPFIHFEYGMINTKVAFAGVADDVTRCKIIYGKNHMNRRYGCAFGERDHIGWPPIETFPDLLATLETHTPDLRAEVKRRGSKKKEVMQIRSVYDEIDILLLDGNKPTLEVTSHLIPFIKPRKRTV